MKTIILLALVSASYGFSIPEILIDKPVDYFPAIDINTSNQPSGVNPRIIPSNESIPHAHPHQISLQIRNGDRYFHICGGSIVGESKIVTAAHCIQGEDIANLRIVAGEHDLLVIEGTEQFRSVQSVTVHPQYSDDSLDYDYAVIRLSSPLFLNENVTAITLASSEPPSGDCVNTGWGYTNGTNGLIRPNTLQQVTIPIVSRPTCKRIYPRLTPRMICAGAPGKGPCRGDSGGPLVCNGQLVGIVSYGPYCDLPEYTDVFANIVAERKWIDSR